MLCQRDRAANTRACLPHFRHFKSGNPPARTIARRCNTTEAINDGFLERGLFAALAAGSRATGG
jgi:hypothetical protein